MPSLYGYKGPFSSFTHFSSTEVHFHLTKINEHPNMFSNLDEHWTLNKTYFNEIFISDVEVYLYAQVVDALEAILTH